MRYILIVILLVLLVGCSPITAEEPDKDIKIPSGQIEDEEILSGQIENYPTTLIPEIVMEEEHKIEPIDMEDIQPRPFEPHEIWMNRVLEEINRVVEEINNRLEEVE